MLFTLSDYLQLIDSLSNKENCSTKLDFNQYIGHIIMFTKNDITYYGIILCNNIIIYFDNKGKLTGYISNLVFEHPYKIIGIYKPNQSAFTLNDIDKMECVYKNLPKKVTKTISELEKELGLEPGTLIVK